MNQGKAKRSLWLFLFAVALILLIAAVLLRMPEISLWIPGHHFNEPSPVEKIPPAERTVYDLILLGARKEVQKKTRYDAAYRVISYPGGDVDPSVGACTDVIIRALRAAGFDLQQLIHEDMCTNFDLYPQLWGLECPDPNIDHRRTQNQMFYFERFGEKLTLEVTEADLAQWRHGDFVYWRFPNGQQHTGVISDRINERGIPLVIHNSGIAREEDCLLRWEIIGHYRFPKEQ
jgi:uncharacterized protein YijF (DUF1287 family)